MNKRDSVSVLVSSIALSLAILACNLAANLSPTPLQPTPISAAPVLQPTAAVSTEAPVVTHVMRPAEVAPSGLRVVDVDTRPTAPERRAPYGDSYQINRLERPFLQDMTYVPSLDLQTYEVAGDTDWWYVTMTVAGPSTDPANAPNYAVELDQDHDGFGDYLLWARPPYPSTWDTAPVTIYQDKNHNTGGLSGERSDAPLTTDGYETRIFNGGAGDADPDMAWVRLIPSGQPTVQFAFKKGWSGVVFMLGVLADSGPQDPAKLDYVDRFTPEEAGSPVRDNSNYPLKALYEVDNICREAFGFAATGYEPQLCPRVEPTKKPKAPTEIAGCPNAPCSPSVGTWHDYPECYCEEYVR